MSKPELHLVSESGTGLRHFHAALRRMASGLCVVTAGHDDDISGVTVASLTSLSIEPPRLLINLSQHASVCRLIARDRWFGINILGSDQLALANRFSTPRLTGLQRFEGLACHPAHRAFRCSAMPRQQSNVKPTRSWSVTPTPSSSAVQARSRWRRNFPACSTGTNNMSRSIATLTSICSPTSAFP
jgi:hypothetical protein